MTKFYKQKKNIFVLCSSSPWSIEATGHEILAQRSHRRRLKPDVFKVFFCCWLTVGKLCWLRFVRSLKSGFLFLQEGYVTQRQDVLRLFEAESDGSKGSHYIHQIMIILVTLWVERDWEEQSAKNGKQKHCKCVDPKQYWTSHSAFESEGFFLNKTDKNTFIRSEIVSPSIVN